MIDMGSKITDLVDTSAEAGVIATLIYHPDFLLIDNNLQPRFFYNGENQILFWAISNLVGSGVTNIDALNLKNSLYSNAAVQRKSDAYGLSNLQEYISMAKIASRGTYEEYKLLADTVISLAFRRELVGFSGDMGKECFNLKITLDDLNDYVNNGISKIAEKFIFGGDTVQFGEKIDSIWEEICEDRNADGSVGIPNLIPSLDNYFTFGNGELVLMAGPTGKGKSSFFLAQAMYTLKRGIPTVIIDTELTDKVYTSRLLANLSGVRVSNIKSGKYTKEEEERIKQCMEWIKKCPGFVHEYQPVFSKLAVEQVCRKWYNKGQLGFLIYDYIKPSERYGAAEISQSLGLMTDFLKSIAGNLNIPVLAGLQLNKMTGNVSDSQKPERYADVLMYWKEKTAEQLSTDTLECGNYYIQVIKNRNGSIHNEDDYVDISFVGDIMKISEAKKHAPHTGTPFEKG